MQCNRCPHRADVHPEYANMTFTKTPCATCKPDDGYPEKKTVAYSDAVEHHSPEVKKDDNPLLSELASLSAQGKLDQRDWSIIAGIMDETSQTTLGSLSKVTNLPRSTVKDRLARMKVLLKR